METFMISAKPSDVILQIHKMCFVYRKPASSVMRSVLVLILYPGFKCSIPLTVNERKIRAHVVPLN